MDPDSSGDLRPTKRRSLAASSPTTIQTLDHDIFVSIFSSLDLYDLARCCAVSKSWNIIIHRSNLFQVLYCRKRWRSADASSVPSCSDDWESLKFKLQELAMEDHRLSLKESRICINQWRGHSNGGDQCRMKRDLILTGVGDKVMRVWSLRSFKCVEEYSVPDTVPIVDFDFDESKIVGLVGTRVCIWRRNGKRSIFPPNESTYAKGLCIRYVDPEAVVGCEDGRARVFDMYSRKCSRIIRMHSGPVTCLSLTEDHLIISGSSLGSITVSSLSSDQQVAALRPADSTGIRTLCYNPTSHLVFAGTTAGYASCWDLRKMRKVWETRASPNVLYTMQHMQNDTSSLVVGGIDGILRVMSQNTGEVLSSYVMEDGTAPSPSGERVIERKRGRRLPNDFQIDGIPRRTRPPITCLAVGMKKVVTTHNGKYIRMWKFGK